MMKRTTRISIIHMLPLEYYPPVTNMIQSLINENHFVLQVVSSHNPKGRPAYHQPHVRIKRIRYPAHINNFWKRLWAYVTLLWQPLWYLIQFKPEVILYMEPHSALPVYLYKRGFRPKVKLFIHHHEYYAPEEFKAKGNSTVRLWHTLETRYLFKKACWISQTNTDRLQMFHKDYPFIPDDRLRTLPNYPPKSWLSENAVPQDKAPLKLLYIGALSFENTYIKDIVTFVKDQQGQIELQIYAYNASQDVTTFLEGLKLPYIHFYKEGVAYHQIPQVAKDCHIGLVLYKAHNLNYTYNAPNKLFEYVACGLEVWVPHVMKGCQPYISMEQRPVVRTVDYTNLNERLLSDFYKHLKWPYQPSAYNCETALQPLIQALKQA